MNDLSNHPLKSVPHQITNPALVPSARYYDEEFFRLENEHMWPHTWQMAVRLEEIPQVGDYTEYKILNKSVIVVRTRTGVKAFHNACRHRGVELVQGSGNCGAKGFICPFHGWRWNSEGENTFVLAPNIFDAELLDKAEINLKPCRLEEWGGMGFINFDNDAPALRDALGPLAERMDVRHLDQMKMEWWYGTVLPTNWKLAMEAFMEGYHVMRTHPQLHAIQASPQYSAGLAADPTARAPTVRETIDVIMAFMHSLSEGMAGMIHADEVAVAEKIRHMDLPEDLMAGVGTWLTRLKSDIREHGQARGMDIPDLNAVDISHPHKTVEFAFPHFFLLPFYSCMSAYRIRPLTAETCLFEIWSLAWLPEDADRAVPREPTMLAYDSKEFPEIPQQDYANLPLQQRGLHNFDNMRLSKDWEGLISNYQRLIDGFIAGHDTPTLTEATRRVNDGYDHPITDIGF